jgi:hypothetical protein
MGRRRRRQPHRRIDVLFGIRLLAIALYWLDERTLLLLQCFSIDTHVALHRTDGVQAFEAVDHFGGRDQHLFRVAAAQRAGAAERPVVDDCH